MSDEHFVHQKKVASSDPQEAWRPLSENEVNERKEVLTSKALEYSAELADSLRAPYVSRGIRWTGETFLSYRETLANRYRLRNGFPGTPCGLLLVSDQPVGMSETSRGPRHSTA